MSERRITVPLEITIHEPDPAHLTVFWMEGGGTYTTGSDKSERLGFGVAGGRFAAYLPKGYAVTLDAEKLIAAGLEQVPSDTEEPDVDDEPPADVGVHAGAVIREYEGTEDAG
jgi:hypothetical protein